MGRWSGVLLVALAAFLVYAGTLSDPLLWDDVPLLDHVAGRVAEGGIAGLLSAEWRIGDDAASGGFYRPVALLVLWLESLAAERGFPTVYHLTSVLLHVANSILVLLCLRGLRFGAGAVAGGLLFALHPVQSESVCFVSQQANLLAAAFLLVTLLAWARERRGETAHPGWGRAAGFASFVLACLSKEAALVFPLALLAWEFLDLPGDGRRRRGALAWTVLLLGGVILSLLVRSAWAGVGFGPGSAAAGAGDAGPSLPNPVLAALMWIRYLGLLAVPWPLRSWYSPAELAASFAGSAGVLLFALAVALAWRGARGRTAPAALAWIVVFLLPVSGIVPLRTAVVAERFLYLPVAGLALLGCALFERAVGAAGPWRRAALGTAVVLALSLGAATAVRTAVWGDPVRLFSDMVASSPGSSVGYLGLGAAHADRGDRQRALEAYAEAVRLSPSDPRGHYNLGNTYAALGRHGEAAAAYAKALALEPGSIDALLNMGRSYCDAGRFEQAIAPLREAITLDPSRGVAHSNLGVAYASLDRWGEAVRCWEEALRLQPDLDYARANLALAYLRAGRTESARREYDVLRTRNRTLADGLAPSFR